MTFMRSLARSRALRLDSDPPTLLLLLLLCVTRPDAARWRGGINTLWHGWPHCTRIAALPLGPIASARPE